MCRYATITFAKSAENVENRAAIVVHCRASYSFNNYPSCAYPH